MQFIVVAYDGTDEKAIDRRMAVREAHLKGAKEMFDNGRLLYASGILNDDGKMIGSMMIVDFESRTALDELWLKTEPYITGNVWENIDIKRAGVAPFCLLQK